MPCSGQAWLRSGQEDGEADARPGTPQRSLGKDQGWGLQLQHFPSKSRAGPGSSALSCSSLSQVTAESGPHAQAAKPRSRGGALRAWAGRICQQSLLVHGHLGLGGEVSWHGLASDCSDLPVIVYAKKS